MYFIGNIIPDFLTKIEWRKLPQSFEPSYLLYF